MDSHYAKRITQLKKGLQEIAEIELVNAKRTSSEAEEKLQELVGLRRTAQSVRNQCATGADWLQWQSYVQSLESRERQQQSECQDARDYADLQQQLVLDAYTEVRKWETIWDRQQREYVLNLQKKEQTLADESAALRHGRSLGG